MSRLMVCGENHLIDEFALCVIFQPMPLCVTEIRHLRQRWQREMPIAPRRALLRSLAFFLADGIDDLQHFLFAVGMLDPIADIYPGNALALHRALEGAPGRRSYTTLERAELAHDHGDLFFRGGLFLGLDHGGAPLSLLSKVTAKLRKDRVSVAVPSSLEFPGEQRAEDSLFQRMLGPILQDFTVEDEKSAFCLHWPVLRIEHRPKQSKRIGFVSHAITFRSL
jgi:hypothetical protein